jgi:5-methylthioadenosine/S-adenosylhomocysteine deaminase
LGTEGGADLLQLETGALEASRFADLVALDLDDLSLQPLATLERQIVNSMQPTAISKVMVGGEVVVADGHLTKMDEGELRARIERVTSGWSRP